MATRSSWPCQRTHGQWPRRSGPEKLRSVAEVAGPAAPSSGCPTQRGYCGGRVLGDRVEHLGRQRSTYLPKAVWVGQSLEQHFERKGLVARIIDIRLLVWNIREFLQQLLQKNTLGFFIIEPGESRAGKSDGRPPVALAILRCRNSPGNLITSIVRSSKIQSFSPARAAYVTPG
jgi:hypothetical protein